MSVELLERNLEGEKELPRFDRNIIPVDLMILFLILVSIMIWVVIN